ncbi:MAG: hypothetical protein AAF936_08445 [Pseudomonadota bacterium]
MARHQLIIRVVVDGPFKQDPEVTIERVKNALPGAEIFLEHRLIAASAGEIPGDVVEAMQSAEYGKINASAPHDKADDE